MLVGMAGLGLDVWVPGVGPLSLAEWPKQELMLGWKGRLKERFMVDMAPIWCKDCTFSFRNEEVGVG